MKIGGTKDIKHYVKKFLMENSDLLRQRKILDIPAGSGISSQILHEIGAEVEAYDLFPELFRYEKIPCRHADLLQKIPVSGQSCDFVLCQEGIEHVSDQLFLLQEFNRVLKTGGRVFLTTPNHSSMRARLSHLLAEAESYNLMPPNELDSIWFSDKNSQEAQLYYGHIFLIGVQKLRLLARISGFRIRKIHHLRVNFTSLVLTLFFYPGVVLANFLALRRALRKSPAGSKADRKKIYREVFWQGIDPRILIDSHLFVELEKESSCQDAAVLLKNWQKHPDHRFIT